MDLKISFNDLSDMVPDLFLFYRGLQDDVATVYISSYVFKTDAQPMLFSEYPF